MCLFTPARVAFVLTLDGAPDGLGRLRHLEVVLLVRPGDLEVDGLHADGRGVAALEDAGAADEPRLVAGEGGGGGRRRQQAGQERRKTHSRNLVFAPKWSLFLLRVFEEPSEAPRWME